MQTCDIWEVQNQTRAGFIACNKMDTHVDTCCAGSNWSLMELTGEVCDVNPFLNSYDPVTEIPVVRCCTVWTDKESSTEYLIVADQILWFGTLMENSLINPNQLRTYGLMVNDDPFDSTRGFGVNTDDVFIPFDTKGTVIYFESHVPTEWEKTHLPIILITGDTWSPSDEVLYLGKQSREDIEIQNIQSLTSSRKSRQIHSITSDETKAQIEQYGETDIELGKISCVYNPKDFCEHLVSAVNIATTYRDDVDQ
jgi:hypothetical protein